MKLIRRKVRKIIKHLIYRQLTDTEDYVKYLRKVGVRIGDGTTFFDPKTTIVDVQNPQMIVIGLNVKITAGVKIISHDYGWAVTKAVYGDVLGSVRPVTIGDNVYIGMNAIIGANSVVTGNIPGNCVAVGSPCRKIYTLEEYHEKRKKAQLDEAVCIARQYVECYGEKPPVDAFSGHFWLWTNKREDLTEHFVFQNNLIPGSEKSTWENFGSHVPMFENYEAFLKYALKDS